MTTERGIVKKGTAQISGATTATICQVALADGFTYAFTARLSARDADGASFVGLRMGGAKRVSGTSSAIGTPVDVALAVDAALVGVVATLDVDAGTHMARLRVTGVALKTIDVYGEIEVIKFQP